LVARLILKSKAWSHTVELFATLNT